MELNYYRLALAAAMTVGASAFSATAAAPVSVIPAEGTQETLQDFSLVFEENASVAWAVTGTDNSPYFTLNGEPFAFPGPNNIGADGNKLTISLPYELTTQGKYTLEIAQASYTVDGIAGEACSFTWDVTGVSLGVTVEPSVNTLTEIQNVKVTFNEAKEVTLAEDLGTLNTPALYLITEDGTQERRGSFYYLSVAGNNLIMSMRDPITDPGEYVVKVPGSCYFLDGNAGQDIEFFYTVVEPSYPEIELSVNPSTDVVETIENIEITFGGVELVEWSSNLNSDTAPRMVDSEGNRVATFAKLGGLDNMLSLGLYAEFDVPGDYTVIIPAGSYKLLGQYHGMDGKEITLNYHILGLSGFSVEPSVNTLTEIQNVKVTFNEAKEVTLAEDLGTLNTPALYLITEDGTQERRGSFYYLSVAGNNLIMSMRDPITDPGEYVVKVPGTCYFLDGNPGQDIEFFYTVIEDYKPFAYTVSPATGEVDKLGKIAITFDNASEAVWNVAAIEENSALYPTIVAGNVNETLTALTSEGNILYVASSDDTEWTERDYYVVTIPAGSYTVDGVEGEEIILAYTLNGLSAVDAIFGAKKDLDVYDVNGRLILRKAGAEALKSLRGIYVIDGKKYILR